MGPRDYLSGTKEALVLLSDGFCYFPGCERPVIEFVDGQPLPALEVAHINAAEPGGPYYDTDMTDDQRRHFDNLILLCKPHHTTVDKRSPDNYPPEVRREWKRTREQLVPGEYRSMLQAVTAAAILDAIEAALGERASQGALVTIDLAGGFETPDGSFAAFPTEGLHELIAANPEIVAGETLALIATARNRGGLPVNVESWSLVFPPKGLVLAGANHYLTQSCPQRLEVGSSVHWRWPMSVVTETIRLAHEHGHPVFDVRADASLATGTTARSQSIGVENLPMWTKDMTTDLAEARRLWHARQPAR